MRVGLETVEANGKLEDGVSYNYRAPARTNPDHLPRHVGDAAEAVRTFTPSLAGMAADMPDDGARRERGRCPDDTPRSYCGQWTAFDPRGDDMARYNDRNKPESSSIDGAGSEADSTLLPMLVGGLVLIVVGAVIVMTFV